MRRWLSDYRSLLKGPDLEEIPDLVFYRPIAYLGVRALLPTPITPNQVTWISILFGLAGAWFLAHGQPHALLWGALMIFLHNILDCADGMLARLRGTGSPFGYLLDGFAGYVGTVPIAFAVGHTLACRHGHPLLWWTLALAAGASMAWWCAMVDQMRRTWQERALGSGRSRAEELGELAAEAERWRLAGNHRFHRMLVTLYLFYCRMWGLLGSGASSPATAKEKAAPRFDDPEARRWADAARPVMRMGILLGPSMQLSAIILAAATNHLEWLLWGTIVVGNIWMLVVAIAQQGLRRRFVATAAREA